MMFSILDILDAFFSLQCLWLMMHFSGRTPTISQRATSCLNGDATHWTLIKLELKFQKQFKHLLLKKIKLYFFRNSLCIKSILAWFLCEINQKNAQTKSLVHIFVCIWERERGKRGEEMRRKEGRRGEGRRERGGEYFCISAWLSCCPLVSVSGGKMWEWTAQATEINRGIAYIPVQAMGAPSRNNRVKTGINSLVELYVKTE